MLRTVGSLALVATAALAQSADVGPNGECQPYALPAVSAIQGGYPSAIWQTANLSTASSDVRALFTALNSSIPNIAPRGTRAGNFTGVSYNGVEDPDCWWTWKGCTQPKIAGLQPDITRCPEPNTWGFTIDDGPNCSHNAYYDFLKSQNQKATLFYIGSNVLDWPLEAQRGLNDGHEICAHTWSHPYLTALTNEEVFAELYYSKKAIKDTLGVTVQCMRPPYGDIDDRVRYISQALGMRVIIWADNTFDYTIATTNKTYVDSNYNAILNKQRAGAYSTEGTIVLSHELNNFTMTEMEQFYPQIKSQFQNIVPVGTCQNDSNPYVEQEYTYPVFSQYAAGTRSISLQTATAVSVDAPLSLPLQTTATGSVISSIAYATGATQGVSSAAGGAGQTGAAAAQTGGSSSSSSGSGNGAPATGFVPLASLVCAALAAVGGAIVML